TRAIGSGEIEALESGDVCERQRERAPHRPQALAKHLRQRDGTAKLITVCQRLQHHMRAGTTGIEDVHIVDPRAGMPDARDIGWLDLDRVLRHLARRAAASANSRIASISRVRLARNVS